MRKGLQLLLIPVIFMFVQGCTTMQPVEGTGSERSELEWKNRLQKFRTLAHWRLDGRASVTYRDENWPFGLQWLQSNRQSYDMLINHPVTRGVLAKIHKSSGSVELTTDKGRVLRDSSAERLLEQQLGIKLPLEGMQYWVLGISAPQYPLTSYRLDANGRPISLSQAGWTISYSGYNSAAYDALPSIISVQRGTPERIRVKLRVKQWNNQIVSSRGNTLNRVNEIYYCAGID